MLQRSAFITLPNGTDDPGRRAAVHEAQERDFTGVLAHDLANACLGIRLSAETVGRALEELHAKEGAKDAAVRIVGAANWMLDLVERLLDLTRLEKGTALLEAKAEPVLALLHQVEALVRPQAQGRGIAVEIRCPQGLVAHADALRLSQVLVNLLGNAVKFSHDRGRIWMSAELEEGAVLFSVRDEGIGMTAAQKARAFDPYWQASQSRHEGIGLGLAIARAVVAAHGGKIWAESDPGKGSTFYFTLPVPTPEGEES